MKKLKIKVSLGCIARKYFFGYDMEDKESGADTEHFLNVLKAWWSREENEET